MSAFCSELIGSQKDSLDRDHELNMSIPRQPVHCTVYFSQNNMCAYNFTMSINVTFWADAAYCERLL